MQVSKDGKTLYHIQNMNITSDGTPYDLFIWCDHYPNTSDVAEAVSLDFEGEDEELLLGYIEEAQQSSDVYAVWAEEL